MCIRSVIAITQTQEKQLQTPTVFISTGRIIFLVLFAIFHIWGGNLHYSNRPISFLQGYKGVLNKKGPCY